MKHKRIFLICHVCGCSFQHIEGKPTPERILNGERRILCPSCYSGGSQSMREVINFRIDRINHATAFPVEHSKIMQLKHKVAGLQAILSGI